MKTIPLFALTTLSAALLAGCATTGGSTNPVPLKVIAFNDFHGNLKQPTGMVKVHDPADEAKIITVPGGGIELMSAKVKELRAKTPHSVVVSAGDLINASPLLSALFHDEPTIEAMNLLGLDINAVGNHEFDDGHKELTRMQVGGCHPTDPNSCKGQTGKFEGAKFRFLAANVVDKSTGNTLFPAYEVKTYDGIPVAFIGMTLKGTPGIGAPKGVEGLEFLDEAETVNKLIPELKAKGIEAIIVVVHEGGFQTGVLNDCKGISGAIVDIVNKLDKSVDFVISGHTHQPYNCVINGIPVTSAFQYGQMLTDIDLELDPVSRDIIKKKATNLVVDPKGAKDAVQTALISHYSPLAAVQENRVIGKVVAGGISRKPNAAGEAPLGDVIADGQLAATATADTGNAVIAFMNIGGIRADLVPLENGDVTYGQTFTVQPFGNSLVTMSLTGEQIDQILEQQWLNQPQPRILQVSAGFSYEYDDRKPAGERVEITSIKLNGKPIDPKASYRVTANAFLADGGDGFKAFKQGQNRLGGAQDLDAFEAFLKKSQPLTVGKQDRIIRVY